MSRTSRAFVDAAEGALLFEEGYLTLSAEKLSDALRFLERSLSYQGLRQFVSTTWKFAELEASFGRPSSAMSLSDPAMSVAQEIGDLHGYCNARIAEAHVALSQDNFKRAVEALLWASHPPSTIGTNQPSPRFIAGELARAWAVVEWQHRLEKGSWLGYVHPLWALKFAGQRLQKSMSFVMRVPFLGRWAIASPSNFHDAILHHANMIPEGRGSRPRFSLIERERIFEYYGGLCALCGTRIRQDATWHVDHIVLHSMGRVPKKTAAGAFLNYRPSA